jgi:hypothetical protein
MRIFRGKLVDDPCDVCESREWVIRCALKNRYRSLCWQCYQRELRRAAAATEREPQEARV